MRKRLMTIMATCLVLATAACSSSEGDTATTASDTTAATVPATTAIQTTTTVALFGGGDALLATMAYFEAFNSGDGEAALTLMTSDAELSDNLTGLWTAGAWEMLTLWNTAQGTTLATPECTVVEEIVGVSAKVTCESANSDSLVQAVGATPVPANVTTLVTAEGISSFRFNYGSPDFGDVGSPFDTWMTANHPDDVEAVGFGNWTSIEEAQQNGALTARYAAEWAAYLDENNCDYRATC